MNRLFRLLFGVFLFVVPGLALYPLPAQAAKDVEWPAIPLLDIVTEDNMFPTFTIVKAPDGCIGTSITDNSYVPGRLVMTVCGDTLYDSGEYSKGASGMRIKQRGNSTAASGGQRPYKLKFSKKTDLLMRGDNDYSHKEWVLMRVIVWHPKLICHQSSLLHAAGTIVSRALEKEWTQDWAFVNVVLNGEYQGMYCLMEPASKGKKRIDIDDTGFIIEHDPFWWNEDGHYFKTDRQAYMYGYTYKYPDKDDVTDSIQNAIRDYMNEFERALYEGYDISDYIDMESFAKWILAHDILGSDDVAGCNKFLYKNDLLAGNTSASKLCMGPLWDFDSSFRGDDTKWSLLHTMYDFYYHELFKRDDFIKTYVRLWKEVRPALPTFINSSFDDLYAHYEATYDESMKLHLKHFPGEQQRGLLSQIEELKERLNVRIATLDLLMKEFAQYEDYTTEVSNNVMPHQYDRVYHISGVQCPSREKVLKGLYIYRDANGVVRKLHHPRPNAF